jgi:tetratricopeptide (TPR) repeat protein
LQVSSIVEELRRYLDGHRPLSDFARTANLHEAETQHPVKDPQQSQAITRPLTPEIEDLTEEMSLSSGNLKEQLREIDDSLQRRLYAEAQRRLWALREQYPHSKNVRARLKQLEQAQAEQTAELQPVIPAPAASSIHSAPTLPPVLHPAAAKEPAPPLPKSSGPNRREQSLSDAESALRSGAMLWNSGRRMQALALFEKAREDDTCGTTAALMAGLCYRELDRPQDAIATFMRAVNRPEIDDKDLSWLFYELGATYEMVKNVGEAILFYQMSLGAGGSFRDAQERIVSLQGAPLST